MFNTNAKVIMNSTRFGNLMVTPTMESWIINNTILEVGNCLSDGMIQVTDGRRSQITDFRNFRYASDDEVASAPKRELIEFDRFDIVEHPSKGRGIVQDPLDDDNDIHIEFTDGNSQYFDQDELAEFTKIAGINDVVESEQEGWKRNTLRLNGRSLADCGYPDGIKQGDKVDVVRKGGDVEYNMTAGDIGQDMEAAFWNYSGHRMDIVEYRKSPASDENGNDWIENTQTEDNTLCPRYPRGIEEGMRVDVVRYNGTVERNMTVGDYAHDVETAYWVVEGCSRDIVKYRLTR